MCPSDYYAVHYEINPWMDTRKKVNRKKAVKQWEDLYDILVNAGFTIELITPVQTLPDMVFTANAGLIWKNSFIKSNFRHKERKGEEKYFKNWFKKKGMRIKEIPQNITFEGEGDTLKSGNIFFAGYITRSDIKAHRVISELTGKLVLSLELVNASFYHLDTCFAALGKDTVIYHPRAFDKFGKTVITENTSSLIEVKSADAGRFFCNAIPFGKNIIVNSGCDGSSKTLENKGYKIIETDLSEFIKAGGSAKCLVLFMDNK